MQNKTASGNTLCLHAFVLPFQIFLCTAECVLISNIRNFLYLAASVTIPIIFRGRAHIKEYVILKLTDAEGSFSVRVSRGFF